MCTDEKPHDDTAYLRTEATRDWIMNHTWEWQTPLSIEPCCTGVSDMAQLPYLGTSSEYPAVRSSSSCCSDAASPLSYTGVAYVSCTRLTVTTDSTGQPTHAHRGGRGGKGAPSEEEEEEGRRSLLPRNSSLLGLHTCAAPKVEPSRKRRDLTSVRPKSRGAAEK